MKTKLLLLVGSLLIILGAGFKIVYGASPATSVLLVCGFITFWTGIYYFIIARKKVSRG